MPPISQHEDEIGASSPSRRGATRGRSCTIRRRPAAPRGSAPPSPCPPKPEHRRAPGSAAGRASARASAVRCRCPPERVMPRSPTRVSKPVGKSSRHRARAARVRAASTARARCLRDPTPCRRCPERDVLRDARGEEEGLLRNEADGRAKRPKRNASARPARPRRPCPGVGRGGAAAGSRASTCPNPWDPRWPPCSRPAHRSSRPGARPSVGVGEREIPAPRPGPADRRARTGAPIVDGRFRVDELVDATHGRLAPLEQVDDPAEGDHGPVQHGQIDAKRDEVAQADRSPRRRAARRNRAPSTAPTPIRSWMPG